MSHMERRKELCMTEDHLFPDSSETKMFCQGADSWPRFGSPIPLVQPQATLWPWQTRFKTSYPQVAKTRPVVPNGWPQVLGLWPLAWDPPHPVSRCRQTWPEAACTPHPQLQIAARTALNCLVPVPVMTSWPGLKLHWFWMFWPNVLTHHPVIPGPTAPQPHNKKYQETTGICLAACRCCTFTATRRPSRRVAWKWYR